MARFRNTVGLLALAGTAVWAWTIRPALSSSLLELDGKRIFIESRCQNCHSVSSARLEAKIKSDRLKGPDLVNVGQRHEADWIAKFLRQESRIEGKRHKLKFKGSDEELQALVDWLLEQKAE